jgi:hypothetical protein
LFRYEESLSISTSALKYISDMSPVDIAMLYFSRIRSNVLSWAGCRPASDAAFQKSCSCLREGYPEKESREQMRIQPFKISGITLLREKHADGMSL